MSDLARIRDNGSDRGIRNDMQLTKAAEEVKAAMIMARQFPRDTEYCEERILRACERSSLAEVAIYTYPRGGQQVEGPSIRLAEELARSWGNIDFGIVELEQKGQTPGTKCGESQVMAYCWDLETNTRQTKVFTVPHWRHTRNGGSALSDPRDIYEMVANQGARRLRACILGVIPGDVVEMAVTRCGKTLEEKSGLTIDMAVAAFAKLGVTEDMLREYLGHALSATTQPELVRLRGVAQSIRDGHATVQDYFTMPEQKEAKTKADQVKSKVSEAAKKKAPRKQATKPKADPAHEQPPTEGELFGMGEETGEHMDYQSVAGQLVNRITAAANGDELLDVKADVVTLGTTTECPFDIYEDLLAAVQERQEELNSGTTGGSDGDSDN